MPLHIAFDSLWLNLSKYPYFKCCNWNNIWMDCCQSLNEKLHWGQLSLGLPLTGLGRVKQTYRYAPTCHKLSDCGSQQTSATCTFHLWQHSFWMLLVGGLVGTVLNWSKCQWTRVSPDDVVWLATTISLQTGVKTAALPLNHSRPPQIVQNTSHIIFTIKFGKKSIVRFLFTAQKSRTLRQCSNIHTSRT